MRRLLATMTALLAGTVPMLATVPAQAAPPTTTIKPGSIPRGPDVKGPHLAGKTIVDGAVTVQVQAGNVLLYGKWHDQYVAATGNSQWGHVRLWRYDADGSREQIGASIDPFNTVLDADADQVAYSYGDSVSKPTIAVFDLGLGKEVNVHTFASLPQLLDFDSGIVIASLASFNVKTVSWDSISDDTIRLIGKQSNYASVVHNLLGYFSADPQVDGCQVLAQLTKPGKVRWTNCDERIEAVSPDAKRVATIPLLSDGIGPADVVLRTIGGKQLAHYSIAGFFGTIWWESPTKLLMVSNGKTVSATVRCKVAVCDRATDLAPTPDFRPVS